MAHCLLLGTTMCEADLTVWADKAVLQQTAMSRLQKPNPRDLRFLKEWLDRPDMGGIYLEGQDSDVWDKPDHLDLITMKPRMNESLLSAWISDAFVDWYHRTIGSRLTVGNFDHDRGSTAIESLANVLYLTATFQPKLNGASADLHRCNDESRGYNATALKTRFLATRLHSPAHKDDIPLSNHASPDSASDFFSTRVSFPTCIYCRPVLCEKYA